MMVEHGNIVIYKDRYGNDNIEVKIQDNTVWLNQDQLVKLYNSSKSNISEHIKHIIEEGELEELSTVRKFRTVASNGKAYNMNYYNLDMIVAIGFRVRSNIGTSFRKWANERLTEYMIKGFTMNEYEDIQIVNFNLEEIRNYRKRETLGDAYRKPFLYKYLREEHLQEPFIRKDSRRNIK